jgi:hypothetical protein
MSFASIFTSVRVNPAGVEEAEAESATASDKPSKTKAINNLLGVRNIASPLHSASTTANPNPLCGSKRSISIASVGVSPLAALNP